MKWMKDLTLISLTENESRKKQSKIESTTNHQLLLLMDLKNCQKMSNSKNLLLPPVSFLIVHSFKFPENWVMVYVGMNEMYENGSNF